MSGPVRIANCSGFLGDRRSATREMVEGGPIDVLTGDYLAELTMAILMRQRMKDPDAGYARVFLSQMEDVLGACLDRRIRVVANAGGLNPAGLAAALHDLSDRLGLAPIIAHVAGDDLMPRLDDLAADGHPLEHAVTGETFADRGLAPITANAYLGGWGIAAALAAGADVVVTGRVSDASLVSGPAAWWHGWSPGDLDQLAGAVVAGHVIECGAQATGGNYSFFEEVDGLDHPGFPIAEVASDGSSVISKHPGTGGAVTRETVTAQLLYEIDAPAYRNPDVVARFDTIRLAEIDEDSVAITGVRGEPPPATTKVAATCFGGFRNTVTVVVPGLDVESKAALVEEAVWETVGGREQFAAAEARLWRFDRPDPARMEAAMAHLQFTVMDPDRDKVGRAFSNAIVELALASIPGFTLTAPPSDASPYAVYWPSTVPRSAVPQTVVIDDETIEVPPADAVGPADAVEPVALDLPPIPIDEPLDVPLGRLAGARSGDKGGDANVGLWARTPEAFAWLRAMLTVERFRQLVPEAESLVVERYELPNLLALNFVVRGLLGEGVASSTLLDPQAKTLGEYLRAKSVDIPQALLAF